MTRTDVAIVGGGLAGLSCALALLESGLEITLFEASSTLGGRARSWQDAGSGDVVDLGPHILLGGYSNMLALLERLGTRDRIVWQTERLLRLTEGERAVDMHVRPLTPPLHLLPSFIKLRSVDWRDKLSNRRILALALRLDEAMVLKLDGIDALTLLQCYGVSRRFIDWFWASACLAVMNVPLEHCSAGALLRMFSQLIGRRDYALGFPDCGLSELFAPHAIERIAGAGGQIRCNSGVRYIEEASDSAGLEIFTDAGWVHARHCVLAVPPGDLHGMIPNRWNGLAPFHDLRTFEPSPYVSTYLWLDRRVTRQKSWTRIWNPSDLNSDFYDLANIRRGWQARSSVIASNCIYSHRAAELSDDEIVRRTFDEIAEAVPGARGAQVIHSVVNRIPLAIVSPVPGSEAKRPAVQLPIPGLWLAGDWTQTHLPSSMESAVYSGARAAEEIWRAIGRPRICTRATKRMTGIAGWVNRHSADSVTPAWQG